MKYLVVLALFGLCNCSDEDDFKYSAKYNDGVDDYKQFEDDEFEVDSKSKIDSDWKKDGYRNRYRDPNVVGLEKNDKEDIVRPCSLDDWQCIRKFFAKNSNCKLSYGPVPDPLYFERNTVYYPFANLTMIVNKLEVRGIAASKISEFYVNKNTGNLVFAIDFKDLNETTPRAYFRYKRTAKETVVLKEFASILIGSGTLTAVIPRVPHLRLDLAEIHADLDNAVPPFVTGPGAVNKDPDVLTGFARLASDLSTAVQEAAIFQAPLFMGIYIQKNICDFGLKLISI